MTSLNPSKSTHLTSQSTNDLTSFVSPNGEVTDTLSTLSSFVTSSNDVSTIFTSTLSSTLENISISTESVLYPASENASTISHQLTTQSTTINDKYLTSIPMSSQNLETHTKETTMQTNSVFSTAVDNNQIFVTSITPTTTTQMKSSLLTSSDNVSNTPTITSTS
ncbi:unnamed protein product, partial [Rotaria sordida]